MKVRTTFSVVKTTAKVNFRYLEVPLIAILATRTTAVMKRGEFIKTLLLLLRRGIVLELNILNTGRDVYPSYNVSELNRGNTTLMFVNRNSSKEIAIQNLQLRSVSI